MKKNLFLLFSVTTNLIFAQNYYFSSPQGYGAAATGGGNAAPITVSNYTAFKNALNSTSAANSVILVSGTIDCVYTSVTLNNKTIIGLPGARLRNLQITVGNSTTSAANSGILNIKPGSNNVIIRNLIFEGPGAYDVDGRDNLTNEGTNIWIDHCEFQDGMDGNFDNKGQADNVTVSWCKFTYLKPAISGGSGGSNDHRFSNLIGSDSSDAPADGHYSITFQNCYWASGCKDRMPRARNSQLHLLNCYFNVNVSGSKAIGLGGGVNNTTCYVQNSHFGNVGTVNSTASSDGGIVAINFNGCLGGGNNIGTVSPPTYSYTTMPVNEVASRISDPTCGSGATLNVNSSGNISPGVCTNLAVSDFTSSQGISIYPTHVKDTLNINFKKKRGSVSVEIFTATGRKIIFRNEKLPEEKTYQLNLENLVEGLYFIVINNGEEMIKQSFIKIN